MKTCTRCGDTKPLTEFYRATAKKDGHETRCKVCARTQVLAYNQTDGAIPLRRIRIARYLRSEKGKAATQRYLGSAKDKQARRRYRQQNREKINARARVWRSMKAGILPKPSEITCDSCGAPAAEYHHPNGYTDESALDIVPLCKPCHYKLRSSH